MLKKFFISVSMLAIASTLGWVGYNGLAKASDEQQSNITTSQQSNTTTIITQGTRLSSGGCTFTYTLPEDGRGTGTPDLSNCTYVVTSEPRSDPGIGECTFRHNIPGNTHGTETQYDNCTFVLTLEPGSGPDMPTNHENSVTTRTPPPAP